MTPTIEQSAFTAWTLSALRSGSARTAIGDAVAGSGKSTTGALTMKAVSEELPEKSIVYLAFGKRNELDMTGKLSRHSCPAKASTIHSLGLKTCGGRLNVKRTQHILEQLDICGKPWWFGLDRLFQAGQNQAYFCPDERGVFIEPGPSDWAQLAYDYDIDSLLPTKHKTDQTWRMVSGWMEKIYGEQVRETGEVTYGDMVWLPLANMEIRARIPKFDLVIVDEYQDLNVSRRIFSNLCSAPNGARLFIGDARQAIMGFSGADTNAFASIRASQNCPVDTLTLSESFRVTQAIAAWARKYVPGFRAAASKPGGHEPLVVSVGTMIDTYHTDSVHKAFGAQTPLDPPSGGEVPFEPLGPGQVILARNNRPLVDMFFSLLESGIEVRIEGTEFAEKIKKQHELFLRRDSSRNITLAAYRSAVAREGYDRAEEYRIEGRKWKAARVLDDTNAWLRVIDFAIQTPAKNLEKTVGKSPFGPKPNFSGPRTVDTVSKVLAYILRVSSDNDDAREKMITLSTIHKSKGLEWDVVWWYGYDALHPSKYAITAEEKQQERNLEYVAGTRSRGPVYLVPLEK